MADVMRYDRLTPEQVEAIKEGSVKFGFEYVQWGLLGHNILVRDPRDKTGETNIRVGYVKDLTSLLPFREIFLEIYDFDGLPQKIKAGVRLILEVCGLNRVETGS